MTSALCPHPKHTGSPYSQRHIAPWRFRVGWRRVPFGLTLHNLTTYPLRKVVRKRRWTSRWSVQPSQAKGIPLGRRVPGATDTHPSSVPAWGIPSSGGFWLPVCFLVSCGTNWKILGGSGHSQAWNGCSGSRACPQTLMGPTTCQALCLKHQDGLVLALGRERNIHKVKIKRQNCYPGREYGHPDWRVREGFWGKWPLS